MLYTDLLSHTYTAAVVQKCHTKDEHRAFCDMVDRAEGKPTVFIADRGYESFNDMAHVQEKGWFFLFRFKDNSGDRFRLLHAGYGRIRYVVFYVSHQKTDERNETVTERQERLPLCPLFQYLRLSACKESHKNIPAPPYVLSFRLVRFKISEDSYETVVANLDADSFPAPELKKLYHMRWGIETSFRNLKHTLGLLHFHAKKTESVLQEIFASLIMYNFTELTTSHVISREKNRKYTYIANFSAAVHVCRQFLMVNVSPPALETLVAKYVSPVRPGRNFPRNLKSHSAVSFLYRIA